MTDHRVNWLDVSLLRPEIYHMNPVSLKVGIKLTSRERTKVLLDNPSIPDVTAEWFNKKE